MSADVAPGARTANESDEASAAANVQTLFNTIAPSYDLLNHLLSIGLDRHWWNRAARSFTHILQNPQARIVDLCCGTGDMTAALVKLRPAQAEPITGLDFSAEMLTRARTKYATANAIWLEGDAMHLPFADNSLDLITAAFGFRNLSNYAAALAEFHRVLRPGGQLGILECNHPDGLRGTIYSLHLHHILPLVGGIISGQREAYRYLPASIARFPRPPQMLALLEQAGFTGSTWDGYFLHAAGLYKALKP
jgi:demethylmenaquinone methyltransferase/2-methoxy-6-polyprenyl-1,4-benzoquinol methylase